MNRRRFLVGTFAAATAGLAGGYEVLQRPSLLHRLGLQHSPDIDIADSGATFERGKLESRHMNTSLRWALSAPEGAIATVYCLHGRGADYEAPFETFQLHDLVAAAQLPLAVASVEGGDHSYWHRRADGTDAGAMLVDEFVPFVEQRTKTSKRALYGWSMGGYGALLAAASHPQMFQAVAALSPALWTSAGASAPGAFDNAADFETHDVFDRTDQLRDVRLRVSCGKDDPFYRASKTFVERTPHAEVDFGDGFHDGSYWRSVSPAALDFIAGAIRSA